MALRKWPVMQSQKWADAWAEYDMAADDLARRGLTGAEGDSLPLLMSKKAIDLINVDPEAFQRRVRESAYALAQCRVHQKSEKGEGL